MTLRPLRECPDCKGDGYKIVRGDKVDLILNPDNLRWVRIPCKRCDGGGFVRE
jgi:predicted nucleic-acid-binding Zn-ribbon protein